MRNQYFLKDKKVKLVTKYSEKNPYGSYVTYYKYLSNKELWAYARQLSQDQVFEAKTYGEDESRFFVINNRSGLKIGDFVEYKGKYYTITRLDTTDDYNGDLFIYVRDARQGDTPKDIQPADD